MIVFTACWENNESFIESCNVCMKHDSDSKPHSLTPATIFAPESCKTKKTVVEIYTHSEHWAILHLFLHLCVYQGTEQL